MSDEPMDELTALLKDAEEGISALGLGVAAGVPMGTNFLRFQKWNKDWLLVVVTDKSIQPLLKASKLTRIEAAPLLDDLVTALYAESERQAIETEKAKIAVGGFLERLRAMPRPPQQTGVTQPTETTGEKP